MTEPPVEQTPEVPTYWREKEGMYIRTYKEVRQTLQRVQRGRNRSVCVAYNSSKGEGILRKSEQKEGIYILLCTKRHSVLGMVGNKRESCKFRGRW